MKRITLLVALFSLISFTSDLTAEKAAVGFAGLGFGSLSANYSQTPHGDRQAGTLAFDNQWLDVYAVLVSPQYYFKLSCRPLTALEVGGSLRAGDDGRNWEGRYPEMTEDYLALFLPRIEAGGIWSFIDKNGFSLGLSLGAMVDEVTLQDNLLTTAFQIYDALEAFACGGLSVQFALGDNIRFALLPRYQFGGNLNFDRAGQPRGGLSQRLEFLAVLQFGPIGLSGEYGFTSRDIDTYDFLTTTTTTFWRAAAGIQFKFD